MVFLPSTKQSDGCGKRTWSYLVTQRTHQTSPNNLASRDLKSFAFDGNPAQRSFFLFLEPFFASFGERPTGGMMDGPGTKRAGGGGPVAARGFGRLR